MGFPAVFRGNHSAPQCGHVMEWIVFNMAAGYASDNMMSSEKLREPPELVKDGTFAVVDHLDPVAPGDLPVPDVPHHPSEAARLQAGGVVSARAGSV